MIAAAHVNVHYLLVLLLPSVAACIILAFTWYSRAKRRRDSEAAKRASRAGATKKTPKGRRGRA